ncbi:MAG: NirA family protein [Deltaproteobacteria bacterium]
MPTKGFTETQKQYLEGLVSGLRAGRPGARSAATQLVASAPLGEVPAGPDQVLWEAQDRFLQAGRRLSPEEKVKRRQPPEDLWRRMARLAGEARFPEGEEVFLYKFHGLFYASSVEDAFMCRLRLAAGQITAHQLRGVAALAERFGHPIIQLTTRGNLQLRGIKAGSTLDVLRGLAELGIVTRGAGADGVRNIRANPTAGFDRRELIDVSPFARAAQYRILADRSLQALPRKFTLGFDGGGAVSAFPETCDLGFRAVRVPPGAAVPSGVYFRLLLGGATSHGRFARDAGVVVAPEHCLEVLEQVLGIYVEHGDRTNRRRARLLYLLESWGLERFMAQLRRRLEERVPGAPRSLLAPLPHGACEPAIPADPSAHIGFHNQKPRGKSYVGITTKEGLLRVDQARGLADLASEYGSGELRLSAQQNLLIPGLPDTQLHRVKDALAELSLGWSASAVRAGLLACTGSAGCPFAAGDVKRRAEELAQHLESQFTFEQPLTIRLSGCHRGCADHGIADIGLLALRTEPGTLGAECYQLLLGGQAGEALRLGREFASGVSAADVPRVVQGVVERYFEQRRGQESFREFVGRLPPGELGRRLGAAPEALVAGVRP